MHFPSFLLLTFTLLLSVVSARVISNLPSFLCNGALVTPGKDTCVLEEGGGENSFCCPDNPGVFEKCIPSKSKESGVGVALIKTCPTGERCVDGGINAKC